MRLPGIILAASGITAGLSGTEETSPSRAKQGQSGGSRSNAMVAVTLREAEKCAVLARLVR